MACKPVMHGLMPNTEQQGVRRAGLLAPQLAGFIAGSALQLQQAALLEWPAYAGMLLLALALYGAVAIKSEAIWWRQAAVLLAMGLLAFALCGLRAGAFLASGLAPQLQGADIHVTGVVSAMPQRGEEGIRFKLDVESASAGGEEVILPPRIYLGWYSGFGATPADPQRRPAELRAGERWQMTVRLKQPHGNSNPHGFDYELWLWEQGLQATGYVRAGARDAVPRRIGATWQHPVERARQSVRDAVLEHVDDRKGAGIIAALVTGDQAAIDRSDWDVFRATGVAHLMSISGLHITMFAWAAALVTGWLWRRSDALGVKLCLRLPAPSAALMGGVLLAAAYALFSGWGVPAQRTVCMLATVALLRLGGRRWPWPHVWLLTCAIVVAADPWALMQPGFWLSFVAVGVLFAAGNGDVQGGPRGLGRRLVDAAREQWVVTLALAPLTLLLFGQVSLVGLLANALAIPWVTLLVTPLAMLGVLWPAFWSVAAIALQALDGYLQWLASLPLAVVSMPAPAMWAGAAAVLGGVVLVLHLPWRMRLLAVPLILPALLWQPARPAVGQFDLLAADVGQGNAVIVRTAGHTLVYDTGPRFSRDTDAGHRVLVPLLRAGNEVVSTVMLSHRDADHTGGAPAVLAMQPQAVLHSSLEDGHELHALRQSTRCEAGQAWEWDGVAFQVLQPAAADYGAGIKSNGMSCVLKITAGESSALLAGDIEALQEQSLLQAGADLKAGFLLVPHHGSKTSSSADFIDAVRPRFAFVQAGFRNRFGHPAEVVAQRYRERGIVLAESARCGAGRWSSALPQALDCHREQARRYWHHHFP